MRPRSFQSGTTMCMSTRRRNQIRRSKAYRKLCKPAQTNSRINAHFGGRRPAAKAAGTTLSSVSDKLEALKNLLPVHNQMDDDRAGGGEAKSDDLFKKTADYILLLRTQIFVLQKLLNFNGYLDHELAQNHNQNTV